MDRFTLALALIALAAVAAIGQQCPQASAANPDSESESRTLDGKLIFHDGIRKWFELKLDQPQCGQSSTELFRINGARTMLEVLRGCRVRSKGRIGFSPTGYYSLETYQYVEEIEAIGECARQAPFPDYSKAKPDKAIRAYRVDIHIDYGHGDHPINFRVSSGGKELRPWQAYASYMLTGGFVLYGHCAEGFDVDKVFGTPEASPSHFTQRGDSSDMATFDPDGAADSGKTDMDLVYTCVRQR